MTFPWFRNLKMIGSEVVMSTSFGDEAGSLQAAHVGTSFEEPPSNHISQGSNLLDSYDHIDSYFYHRSSQSRDHCAPSS